MVKKAVILLSGGLDSSTVLAVAMEQGYEPYTISFDYNQRHRYELKAAENIANHLGAKKHIVVDVDLTKIGGSALTDKIEVPKNRKKNEISNGIPITYVPARNIVFLSIALGYAEVIGANDIFIGANVVDYSGYPDCRPEFIEAFEKMANLGTKAGVENNSIKIHAPLSYLTKAQIIKKGIKMGVDYSLTLSCYDPDENGRACGRCDSCLLRKKGFHEAGIADPTVYE